jgi:hypothetical protein
MTTTQKCEHPGCNCQPAIGKKHCSTECADEKKSPEDTVPVQAPGMQRCRSQDVAWLEPDSSVSREFTIFTHFNSER